jgi:hypothetical protein
MTMHSLLLACLWIVAANVAGMLPSRRGHWPAAVLLIATGVPLLGLVTWQHGPVAGLVALAAGASILRWPIRLGMARLRPRERAAKPVVTAEQVQPAE